MRDILIPTDFSEAADAALNFAAHAAEFLSAKIILMHSLEMETDMYSDYVGLNKEFNQDMHREVKEQLELKKAQICKVFPAADVETLVEPLDLQKAVSKIVKDRKIDFVIMGTQGADGAVEKIIGSHTSKVIGNSKVPVLAIPSQYVWRKPQQFLLATKSFEKGEQILNFIFKLSGLFAARVDATVFTDEAWDSAGTYKRNQDALADYEAYLKTQYSDAEIASVHLLGTDFEKALEDYILYHNVDILTMVTHGAGFWKRLFNQSITRKVSFHSLVPLLAIPADY